MLHILFKRLPLWCGMWTVIQPEDEIILRKVRSIQVIPIGRRSELKVIFPCSRREEANRLMREIHMIMLDLIGVHSKNAIFRTRTLSL